ncbi:hypothetical protein FERRO_06230 [Ferrovum sp. JA12]|uniref:hypothetical protein n=1 Tax=Ferrovum sp. JA12 TaxID=1356299 RepID=UPI00070252FC|nr:hypothetical protein [Ferrovum sp. JA12]KRH79555.1 hypothetical protein FERRO_06230 [Ferrovum sp. JA12]
MNTERDNVKAALIEVTGGSRRNKTARLRDYYDWVMEAKAAGASNKVLVNALAKNGLIFDIDTFKHALHRIKKERVIDALIIKSAAEVIPVVEKSKKIEHKNVSYPTLNSEKPNKDAAINRIEDVDLINKTSLPGFGKTKPKAPN